MSHRFSDPSRVVTCSLCGSKQRGTTIRAHYRKCFAADRTTPDLGTTEPKAKD